MQTNAAVAEPMVEKMKKRNETSAADRIRSYLRHPGSGVLALLTIGAAIVTFAVLLFPGGLYSGERYPISDTKFIQSGIYIRKCISDAITDQHLYYDSFIAW